jgi:hypothetical protein
MKATAASRTSPGLNVIILNMHFLVQVGLKKPRAAKSAVGAGILAIDRCRKMSFFLHNARSTHLMSI